MISIGFVKKKRGGGGGTPERTLPSFVFVVSPVKQALSTPVRLSVTI